MAMPLPVADSTEKAADDWARFLSRRDDLTAQMALGTCDGCNQCSLRCTAGFPVSRAEYDAVQTYLARQPPAETARIAAQERVIPWHGLSADDLASGDYPTITRCRYHDGETGYCSIYPVRPTICRLFGHTPWLPCPIDAVPYIPDGSLALWHEYAAFEQRTWEGWDDAAR